MYIYIICTTYTHIILASYTHTYRVFPCISIDRIRTKCWRSTLSRRWLRQAIMGRWMAGKSLRHMEENRGISKEHMGDTWERSPWFMRRIHENIWETMGTYGKNIDKWRFWWAFLLCNGHFNGTLITLNWEFFSMPCLPKRYLKYG